MAVSHVKTSPVADMTGTVTVMDSQGSTATVAATCVLKLDSAKAATIPLTAKPNRVRNGWFFTSG